MSCGNRDVKLTENELVRLCRIINEAREFKLEDDAENDTKGEDTMTQRTDITNKIKLEHVVGAFGMRLLQHSFRKDNSKNVLISPLSVIAVLAMAANGARGETLRQMEDTFGVPISELNRYLAAYLDTLPEGEKYKLHLANAIWVKESKDFDIEQDFLRTNEEFYHADLYTVSFDDTLLHHINRWVKDNTDGMIEEILDKISPDAVMYLVNALSFDAQWQNVYYEHQVREGIFTKEDGTVRNVEMMYSSEHDYLDTELAEGFLKYYAGRKYAFAALLPREGVAVSDLVDTLTGKEIYRIFSGSRKIKVNAAIPKYQCEYKDEMNEILQEMGVTDAFDKDRADFLGIGLYGNDKLYVSKLVHSTFMEVNEKGTKAGAATMAELCVRGAALPEETKMVYLDSPFVYMLIDCENNLPIFTGITTDVIS